MPIAIVVDTDIVRAASDSSDANHAVLCAHILEAIRHQRTLILALSKELKKEWLKERENASGKWNMYISPFAYFWMSDMKSRGRVRMYVLDNEKREQILSHFNNGVIRKRVQKDLHVVLTALSADKRLISGNYRERRQFQRACSWAPFLADILWPDSVSEEVIKWLQDGAFGKPEYLLCN